MFLRRAGVRHSENVYDTHLLAEMLLPGLGASTGWPRSASSSTYRLSVRHRAVADAEASLLVFLRLRESRALELPAQTLAQADAMAGADGVPVSRVLPRDCRNRQLRSRARLSLGSRPSGALYGSRAAPARNCR